MGNKTENEDRTLQKVGIRLEDDIHAIVDDIRIAEDRTSIANTVERLVKTHPEVVQRMGVAEPAKAA